MSTPGGANGGYNVGYSKVVESELLSLQRIAAGRGEAKKFATSFRRILRALTKNPHTVGEPLYRLAALRLQVRTVVIPPLVIDFAVHETRPFVFLKSGKLLSGGEQR